MGHGNANVFLQRRYLKSGANFSTSFLCTILALGSANILHTKHSLAHHQGAGHRGNYIALGEVTAGAKSSVLTQLTTVLSVQVDSQPCILIQTSLKVLRTACSMTDCCRPQAGQSPYGKLANRPLLEARNRCSSYKSTPPPPRPPSPGSCDSRCPASASCDVPYLVARSASTNKYPPFVILWLLPSGAGSHFILPRPKTLINSYQTGTASPFPGSSSALHRQVFSPWTCPQVCRYEHSKPARNRQHGPRERGIYGALPAGHLHLPREAPVCWIRVGCCVSTVSPQNAGWPHAFEEPRAARCTKADNAWPQL